MSIPFFYEPYSDAASLKLKEVSVHHAVNVLRMREGEYLWVTNGKGEQCYCKIISIGKKSCDIQVEKVLRFEQNVNGFHLAISFTKNPSRIEWLLEKATEMGIASITPLMTKRSEKTFFKKERFEKILISAMLQSQQTFLPELSETTSLEKIIESNIPQKYIAYCGDEVEKLYLESNFKKDTETLILIGPEGDFTSEEVHLCLQKDFQAVSLGKNRLRTETAGLYACAVFNSMQK